MAIKQRPVAKNQHGGCCHLEFRKTDVPSFLTKFNEIR